MSTKHTSHNEYLVAFSSEHQIKLQALREIIRTTAPHVVECISCNLPAFGLNGRTFIYYGGAASHCALYGVSQSIIETNPGKDQPFDNSGNGTVRFPWDQPLPVFFIKKLVQALIAQEISKHPTSSSKP